MAAHGLREEIWSPHPKKVPGMEAEPMVLPNNGFQSSQAQGRGKDRRSLTVNELESFLPSCGSKLFNYKQGLLGETRTARGLSVT